MTTRSEFLAARRTGIGGSDIGAILGLNHFKTAYDVFLDKTAPETVPYVESEATYWGTVLEDTVAKEYQRRSGNSVQRINHILRHPEHDFAVANIDRAVVVPKIARIVRWKDGRLTTDKLLECKTANSRVAYLWGEPGTDSVPDSYLCQCQWYLGVTGCQIADLAVLIGGQDYRIYTIARDDDLFADMLEAARTFWQNCQKGIAPDPSTISDAMKKWPQHIAGKSVVVDVDIKESCDRLAAISEEKKALETEEEYLKVKVLASVGDAEKITFECDTIATWKTQKTIRLDGTRLRNELPDIAGKYTKTTESRVFRLKKGK